MSAVKGSNDSRNLFDAQLAAAKAIGGNLDATEKKILERLSDKKNPPDQAELLKIQIELDQASRASSAFSNILKKISDLVENAINNLR